MPYGKVDKPWEKLVQSEREVPGRRVHGFFSLRAEACVGGLTGRLANGT